MLPWPKPEAVDGTAANGLPRESVWDYPRPPRLEAVSRPVRVELHGGPIATSEAAMRVCETAGPPVVYVPLGDVVSGALQEVSGGSFCEWKGNASYYDVVADGEVAKRAAWAYRDPSPRFTGIAGYIAFYPGRVECYLGDERVTPQPGEFYGGWITAEISGPFKGIPGSEAW